MTKDEDSGDYTEHPDYGDYPEFRNPIARPRYTGIATFLRAPFQQNLAELDIGIVGVPFDGGVTNRPGARHGPREVRNQSSLLRLINQASGDNASEIFLDAGMTLLQFKG